MKPCRHSRPSAPTPLWQDADVAGYNRTVPILWTWDPDEPLMLVMSVHNPNGTVAVWQIDRNLLAETFLRSEPADENAGFARLYLEVRGQLTICLSDLAGETVLTVPSAPLAAYLGATHRAISPAREAELVLERLDAALAEIDAEHGGSDGWAGDADQPIPWELP